MEHWNHTMCIHSYLVFCTILNLKSKWFLASERINRKLLRSSQIISLPKLQEEHSCGLPHTAHLSHTLPSLLVLNPSQWTYLLCATVTSLTCYELRSSCITAAPFPLSPLAYSITYFTCHESENYFLLFPYQRHIVSQAIFHLPHFHLNKNVFTERVYTFLSTTQG